jgi:hypothetical protein
MLRLEARQPGQNSEMVRTKRSGGEAVVHYRDDPSEDLLTHPVTSVGTVAISNLTGAKSKTCMQEKRSRVEYRIYKHAVWLKWVDDKKWRGISGYVCNRLDGWNACEILW